MPCRTDTHLHPFSVPRARLQSTNRCAHASGTGVRTQQCKVTNVRLPDKYFACRRAAMLQTNERSSKKLHWDFALMTFVPLVSFFWDAVQIQCMQGHIALRTCRSTALRRSAVFTVYTSWATAYRRVIPPASRLRVQRSFAELTADCRGTPQCETGDTK